MSSRFLQRAISKSIEPRGPIQTGVFLRRGVHITEEEKRYFEALSNYLPEKVETVTSSQVTRERQE